MIRILSAVLAISVGLACLAGLPRSSALTADDGEPTTGATVTVLELERITLTPQNPNVTLTTSPTLQFTATAHYSDNSTVTVTGSANWTSSNLAVATIGSTTGQATILISGSTTIAASFGGETGTTTLTVLPGATSSPGGGGGGGGGVVGERSITSLMAITTPGGRILEDVEARSVDVRAVFFIKKDTVAKNRAGTSLTSISIEKMTAPPDKSPHTEIIGNVYDITPRGAQFEPPANLALLYEEKSVPAGISENDLYVATWNEEKQDWEKMPSTIDIDNNRVAASLNHLSIYAIMAGTRPVQMVSSQMTLNPREVYPDQDVSIGVLITNTGDLAGSYSVALKINDVVVETKNIELAGQASQNVLFTVNRSTPGNYVAGIGTLSATFTVKEAATPPSTTIPVMVPVPAPKTTPAATTMPAPASTPTPVPPTTLAPTPVGALPVLTPRDNWPPILFGILGGAAVVLVLVILRQRRR